MKQPFRIEKKKAFTIIGYRLETTNRKREGRTAIPQFWQVFKEQDRQAALLPLMDQEPCGILGISVYNTDATDAKKFAYYIGVSSKQSAATSMDTYTVPAATWAIFPCTSETIGKTEVQAITKWLPRSGYQPLNSGYLTGKMKSGAPDIEYYDQAGVVEVWIAVKEK